MNYSNTLEQFWQDHLAPKFPSAPTVISTFAGCGSSSLGYSMAGFRELLAVEWDEHAAATFKANFPEVPLYQATLPSFRWSAPAPTILKTVSVSATFGAGLMMPDEDRYVSIAELKRLGSFPDQFQLEGSFEERWARIGNSVPPLLMRAIALHIKNEILDRVHTCAARKAAA